MAELVRSDLVHHLLLAFPFRLEEAFVFELGFAERLGCEASQRSSEGTTDGRTHDGGGDFRDFLQERRSLLEKLTNLPEEVLALIFAFERAFVLKLVLALAELKTR